MGGTFKKHITVQISIVTSCIINIISILFYIDERIAIVYTYTLIQMNKSVCPEK